MQPIGLLGGTFDPIHFGHLRTALELHEALELSEVRFLPCHSPPHRGEPAAGPEARRAMVVAAIRGQPGFVLDARELGRDGPSYTVDTLVSLREDYPSTPLCLLLGTDAFAGLARWHRWQKIPELAHIVVARRPGSPLPADGAVGELLAARRLRVPAELRRSPGGGILVHEVTPLEISATAIRESVASGRDPRFLVPDSVRDFIIDSGCYRQQEVVPENGYRGA